MIFRCHLFKAASKMTARYVCLYAILSKVCAINYFKTNALNFKNFMFDLKLIQRLVFARRCMRSQGSDAFHADSKESQNAKANASSHV